MLCLFFWVRSASFRSLCVLVAAGRLVGVATDDGDRRQAPVCACDQPNAMWRFGWTNGSTIDLSHSDFEPLICPLDGTSIKIQSQIPNSSTQSHKERMNVQCFKPQLTSSKVVSMHTCIYMHACTPPPPLLVHFVNQPTNQPSKQSSKHTEQTVRGWRPPSQPDPYVQRI